MNNFVTTARNIKDKAGIKYWPSLKTAGEKAEALLIDLGIDPEEHVKFTREKSGGRPREEIYLSNLGAFFILVFVDPVISDRTEMLNFYKTLAME